MAKRFTPKTALKAFKKYVAGRVDKLNKRFDDYFLSHLNVTKDGCWEWEGQNRYGVPVMYVGSKNGKQLVLAVRRMVFAALTGREPEGNLIATCNNRACINPRHMYLSEAYTNPKLLQKLKEREELMAQIDALNEELRRKKLTIPQIAKTFGLTRGMVVYAERRMHDEG